jgi:hypothetical protein
LRVSLLAPVSYPLLFLSAGTFILYGLGGFPPLAWRELSHFWPILPMFMQQGQYLSVFFLVAPAACWLIAWTSLALIALLIVYRIFRVLLFTPGVGQERKLQVTLSKQ